MAGWKTDDSSGLLGHFVGTVRRAFWDTNARFDGDGKTVILFWDVTVDDVLQEDFTKAVPETVLVGLTVGKGWFINEDGRDVVHEDDQPEQDIYKDFGGQTVYGKFIKCVTGERSEYPQAVVLDGGDSEVEVDLTGVGQYMGRNKLEDPRWAPIWEGFRFEFRGLGFKWRGMEGDPRSKPMPTRLVATPDVGAPAGDSSTGRQSAQVDAGGAEADVERATTDWTQYGATEDVARVLDDLQRKSSSHTEFMRNALMLDAVKNVDTLKAAVMDESVYDGKVGA